MFSKAVIDFGSRSTKVYVSDGHVTNLVLTYNRDLISQDPAYEDVADMMKKIISSVTRADGVSAISTEAARRSTALDFMLAKVCQDNGISYQKISQTDEAALIREAFSDSASGTLEIMNVGGGSIQIVRPDGEFFLLPFGISDLNKKFFLSGNPSERRILDCVQYVSEKLPQNLGTFIYTGGEKTYLLKMGVNIDHESRCLRSDFARMATQMASQTNDELELLSPYGQGWMSGANASNCIVVAALDVSKQDSFYASDLNIAHGVAQQLMRKSL